MSMQHREVLYAFISVMRNLFILFLIFAANCLCISQNLIPNSSFEEYNDCPESSGEFEKVNEWGHYFSTPDYYNYCGYYPPQFTRSPYLGNAISRIVLWTNIWFGGQELGYHREYISCYFKEQLKINRTYYISIAIHPINSRYIGDNLGILFTEDPITEAPDTNYIRTIPQIEWSNYFPDTGQWTIMESCYIADGTEKVMTIGGFHNYNDISFVETNNNIISYTLQLDDVHLHEIIIPEDRDTTACPGTTIDLVHYTNEIPYEIRESGAVITGTQIEVQDEARVFDFYLSLCDTGFQITVYPDTNFVAPDLDLVLINGQDSICEGECIELSAPHSVITGEISWITGVLDTTIIEDSLIAICYNNAGTYSIQVNAEHCNETFEYVFSDTIKVLAGIDYQPSFTDTSICFGQELFIDLSDIDYEITWQEGSDEKRRVLSEAGEYIYSLTNGSCEAEYSIKLTFSSTPSTEQSILQSCPDMPITWRGTEYRQPGNYSSSQLNSIGCDSILYELNYQYYPKDPIIISGNLGFCPGKNTVLEVISAHSGILWSNNSSEQKVSINQAGTYQVEATDVNGCQQVLTIEIKEYPVPQVIGGTLRDIWYQDGINLPVSYIGQIEQYLWNNGEYLNCDDCSQPQLIRYREGEFEVIVISADGCRASGTVTLDFINAAVYVPNTIAIKANQANNSSLYLQSDIDISYDLQVFDRWGGVRFEAQSLQSNNANLGWNPTDDTQLNSSAINPGVFLYLIKYQENGQQIILAGDVTVVR